MARSRAHAPLRFTLAPRTLVLVLGASSFACSPTASTAAEQPNAVETSATPSEAKPSAAPEPAPAADEPTASDPPAADQATQLTLIADRSQVCMVNNQYMGKPQIPVDVNGTTYYGCCEMCKGKLASDPSSRVAIDPVSKREIDKAVAVMAQDQLGTVTYFESEANFERFKQQARPN